MTASTPSSEETRLMLCPDEESISLQIVLPFHATQINA